MLCYRASSQQQRGVWSLRQGTGKTNYEVTTTKMHVCFAKTKKNLKKDIQISTEIYKPGKRSDRHARAYTDICKQTKIKTHESNRLCDVSGGNQWPTNAAKVRLRNHFIALCQPWSEPTLRDRQGYRSLRTMQTHTHTQTSFTSQIIFWTQLDLLLLLSERCCWGTPWRLYP